MKRYLLGILFSILLFPPGAQAKTMYVIDYFKIMVRSQPGGEYKIIDQLSSNEKVTVLRDTGDWTHIRFKNNKTGWVLSRFLTSETPKAIRIAELEKKLEDQTKKITSLDKENFTLKKKNVELGQRMNELLSENQRLKEEPFRILLLLAGGGIFLVGCITTLILQSVGRKKKGSSLSFEKGLGP